jgi:actin related protein 2/3 complex subunit 1A/1B
LTQHEALVTSIDWAHNSNQILSCSQDRNAYIWRFSRGSWKPALFLLRTTRGATRCKWSPKEDKFVVTTAEKLTCVCYDDNGFSISKHIKKHESTVLDAAWHPNNFILATVSSDSKCHIVSGFISYVDNKENIGTTSFGDRLPFGKHVKTYEARAWIHCVKWSTSGTQLAYASHDSTLTVVDVSTADHAVQAVRYNYLPLLDLLWINEHSLVGVGYDGVPLLFQKHGAEWYVLPKLNSQCGLTAAVFVQDICCLFRQLASTQQR